jgi:iron complex outermembrane receptor protein
MQMIFRQGPVPLLFNAGEATIQGLEAEFTYRPVTSVLLQGGFSTLDDEIKSVTQIPGVAATVAPGDELPLTPSFQGNLGLSVRIPLNDSFALTPRVDGSYTSSLTFITPGSDPSIEQDAYFVGNLSVTLANLKRKWQVVAGVLNLFDELYLLQGNASLGTLGYAERIYARPRNWFMQVSIDF